MIRGIDTPSSSDLAEDAFAKALKRKSLSPVQQSFLDQVAADWRAEELPGVAFEELSANLADFWRFAETLATAEPKSASSPRRARAAAT